ncbi:MAG: hypothetical protein MJZ25_10485 [Fibrobacter sp.]|nr:hypothetical protein [Fibrobacter sp.]
MLKKILLTCVLAATFSSAQEAASATAVVAAPAEGAAETGVEVSSAETAAPSVENELKEEIAVRDSVMAAQSESCSADKDSLRKALEVEQAKSANWEQSYETIKKDNALCAQALGVSIGVNEKKKEEVDEAKKAGSSLVTTSFIGGVGIGMLIFWLIFGTGGK